jgi:mannosyltransferase
VALVAGPPTLLALLLGLVGAASRGLWNDEYATWYGSTLPFADLQRMVGNIDAVLAPYYVPMHLWIWVFGESELSLRAPAVLGMAAAAGLTALLGRRLFGPVVGLTGGLLFAVLPAVSRYGQEARPYGIVVALVVLAALLLLRAVQDPTWGRWAGYAATIVAIGLAQFVALTVVLAHGAFVLWTRRGRRDGTRLGWLLAAGGAGVALLPLAWRAIAEVHQIDWIGRKGLALGEVPERLFGSVAIAVVLVGLALIAPPLLWRIDRRPLALLLSWTVLPPLFCAVTFEWLHLFLHRYFLFTLPAWALLAAATVGFGLVALRTRSAAGAWWVPRGLARAPRWAFFVATVAVVAAVAAVGLPGQVAVRRDPVAGEPDFRGAAAVLAARLQAGDGIAFSSLYRNVRRSMGYELRDVPRPPRDVFLAVPASQTGWYVAEECTDPVPCAGTIQRIWLVTTNSAADPYGGMLPGTAALLRANYNRSEVARLTRVRVILLTRRT